MITTLSAGPTAWEHTADSRVFRFAYRGPPRPLRGYLTKRYGPARGKEWARTFFPERVLLNGAPPAEGAVVAHGDQLNYRHLRADEPPPPTLAAPLHEDEWLVALHKPAGIPVDPAGVYYFTCLVMLARERLGLPGLVPIHRLDLETAGPLLFAKRAAFVPPFQSLFTARAIRKRYRALVHGAFPDHVREIRGVIEPDPASAVATRMRLAPTPPDKAEVESLTRVTGVRHCPPYSEVALEPVTGKTNQLRVHLAALGHPIVGDKKYHADEAVALDWLAHRDFARLRDRLLLPRHALLCEALEFAHPFTAEGMRLTALPGSWRRVVEPLAGTTPREAPHATAPPAPPRPVGREFVSPLPGGMLT